MFKMIVFEARKAERRKFNRSALAGSVFSENSVRALKMAETLVGDLIGTTFEVSNIRAAAVGGSNEGRGGHDGTGIGASTLTNSALLGTHRKNAFVLVCFTVGSANQIFLVAAVADSRSRKRSRTSTNGKQRNACALTSAIVLVGHSVRSANQLRS